MNSQEKILRVVSENRYYTAYEIQQKTGLSRTTIYKHLKQLVKDKRIGCCDIGIYSPNYRYLPAKFSKKLNNSK